MSGLAAKNSFLYNFAVFREVVKQVYRAELQPPKDLTTIRTAYETLYQRAMDASYWRSIMQSGEIAKVGIYAVEAYGIFKVSISTIFPRERPFIFPPTDRRDYWTEEACWLSFTLERFTRQNIIECRYRVISSYFRPRRNTCCSSVAVDR